MTEYKPIFRSPITQSEQASASPSLTLSDLTGAPIILIQGEASPVLQAMLSVTIPTTPGALIALSASPESRAGLLACLLPAEFYLFGQATTDVLPATTELAARFAQAGCFAHATDYTHGKAVLKLSGPAAGDMLTKICGLDFHPAAFPNMHVKQTSAAKIKTLIARCDEEEAVIYYLHVDRPLGQYFWDTVWDAGQEFGINGKGDH